MKKYPVQIKKFGKKIKELRLEADLTQTELAKKSGIDLRTIQRIEGGQLAIGLHIVFALSKSFEVTPSELLQDIKLSSK